MATLDQIFTKSNLEESKKKAKMMFGKVLISLRKSNHIKLYSLLESVVDTDIVDDTLKLTMSDKVAYEMINNRTDLDVLNETIKSIQPEIVVELCCNGKEPLDLFKFESRLREEFGKLLTIKKD